MRWIKQLGLAGNQKVGASLVLLLLLVGFVGFGWQALRPLFFNSDPYDFNSYYLSAWATQHGMNAYDFSTLQSLAAEMHVPKVTDYRYPPFYTLLLLPLSFVPYPVAAILWRVLNLALILLAVWLIVKTLSLRLDARNALVIGLIVFNFDPLVYNLAIGQINLVILILLTGAAFAWTRQRHGLGGVLLALAASIKVAPAVFLLYFLWKKGFRFVLSAIAATVAFAGLGFLALGEQATRTFIKVVTSFAQEDTAWIGNQSLRGFLARIFVGDEFVQAIWPNAALERWLYYGGAALFIALTAFILFRSRRANYFHLEFALVLITFHLISPITWVHHFVWTIYPLVVIALACLDRENVAQTILFGVGYLLIALPLDYRNDMLFQWPASLWISTKLYGLLILYGVTAWLLSGLSAPKFSEGELDSPQVPGQGGIV